MMIGGKEIDKLNSLYSFRLPDITKAAVDRLSPSWKKKLAEAYLITTAKILHEAEFDPSKYLSSD
jgi:hypothetical protein